MVAYRIAAALAALTLQGCIASQSDVGMRPGERGSVVLEQCPEGSRIPMPDKVKGECVEKAVVSPSGGATVRFP